MSQETLFHPYTTGQLDLKNRLVVAPMTRVSASEDGVASEKMKLYYEDFARGGFGMVITEGIYIDDKWSQTYAFQAGIVNSRQAAALRIITDAVHAQGSKIIAQIQHSGALSQGNHYCKGSVAPSVFQPVGEQLTFYRGDGRYPIPRALSESEIHGIIESFADAAERAVTEGGFDGVEIHGANGYLLDQFLTRSTNMRDDKWGGDTAGRMTMILEVIKAVRSRLDKKFTVGVRISQGKVNDFQHKWENGEDDARVIFSSLNDSGVDYIHVTEYEAWKPAFEGNSLSLVEIARKYIPKLTIIANGSLHNVSDAEKVLEQGADIIALGRGALANHDWPLRVQKNAPLYEFNREILQPIANIKDCELPV